MQLSEHPGREGAPVPGEMGAHPGTQIICPANVEDVAGGIAEPVDARCVWEHRRETQFACLGMTDQLREIEEFRQPENPERTGPLEERVE
jgi:hypothetical protein